MPLPSDVRFQRLLKMQFPRGSPALVVQNTFIYVDDGDSATARKGCRSNTLPAVMPNSMQRAAFLKELGKLKDTDSIASTAGSELGFNQTCDTDDTTSAASCVSSPEQAHQTPTIHLALPSQDPVHDLPSLKFRQEGDSQNLTAGEDDDCSPLRRWSYIGESSLAGQQASDESSILGTPADDSSPSLANLRRQKGTGASSTTEELTTSRPGDSAPQTSVGKASLTSIGSKSSPTQPQSPLVNQPAELLYRMVNKAPRPQPLYWTQCRDACCFSVCWTLDARKVRGNDKQVVSPLLELPLAPGGRHVKLRLMIYPREAEMQRVQNFRSSRSRGLIQIKCEPDRSCPTLPVRFALAVGTGSRTQGAKGPVDNDFAKNNMCGLPKYQDDWDFFSATDTSNMTVPVYLELTRIDVAQCFEVR